jgi:endoglycosylceramidase
MHGQLPWHKKEDYQKLKEHGFNLVRFLIYWDAIEPEQGKYNLDYIKKVKEHISILEDLGIAVLLDVHQDLYNVKFIGNGFPDWTLPKEECPLKIQHPWYMNYLQKAVRKSYDNFWNSIDLKKSYVDMLIYLQEQFVTTQNIIGIDVMNEPFPTLPRFITFEKKILVKFYQYIELTKSIKFYTKTLNSYKIPFFFEPAIWGSTGIPSHIVKKDCSFGRNFIPHYYPPFCHTKGEYRIIDKWLMNLAIRAKAREAQVMKSPYIIGEFGISDNVKNKIDCINDFSDLADKHLMSWAYWSYDKEEHSAYGMLDNNGYPNKVMKTLTRAYPQKIAGLNPIFYTKDSTFYLEYTCDTSTDASTEIFIPGKVSKITTNTKHNLMVEVVNGVSELIHKDGILKFYQKILGKQLIEVTWQST